MTPVTVSRPPTLLDVLAWLWRWFLDSLVALLTHPAAGKHAGRPDHGADEVYITDLHTLNVQLVDDRDFGLFCGVLTDDTVLFTDLDRLDADRTFPGTLKALGEWPNATDVAFAASARRAGDR